jgi:hypothetical protein
MEPITDMDNGDISLATALVALVAATSALLVIAVTEGTLDQTSSVVQATEVYGATEQYT